jgi:hypothetical protein
MRASKNRRTYGVALDPTSVELLLAHLHRAVTRTDGMVDGSAATAGVIRGGPTG